MKINSLALSLFIGLAIMNVPAISMAQFSVTVRFGPPPIPVYEQPVCPGDGFIWVPGYWAWDGDIDDYYWVPGTWVMAPEVGFLWTPPYWGWNGVGFVFYEGYWGPHVGFYGGINYGFGYFGNGYEGGRWDHDHFYYNRAVTNVNVTNITNVYNTTVVKNNNHVSYNGGEGGITAKPTKEQQSAVNERRVPMIAAQQQHMQAAQLNPQMRASTNHGKPPLAATEKPGNFNGGVAARQAGGEYHPNRRGGAQPRENRRGEEPKGSNGNNGRPEASLSHPVIHPNDLPAIEHGVARNTGDAKLDQKYQKQQAKMEAQEAKERQKLQAQQDREDQRLVRQNVSNDQKQQTEQKHQQQTQQMQQRHDQQRQDLQKKTQPQHRG